MELYLLRHGLAVPRDTRDYPRDADRPLTPAGIKKTRQIAKGMKKLGLTWDRILSSPYLRTKQTAEIVASIYKKTPVAIIPALMPEAKPGALGALLHTKKSKRLLLVGHEPFLSQFISLLLTGREQAVSLALKKGGLCVLTTKPLRSSSRAELQGLLTPRQLCRLGKS